MKKILTILFVILSWMIATTALASPILNNGEYIPIQLNKSGISYGEYVNSGDFLFIMPSNDSGNHFADFNLYMETNYDVSLTPVNTEYTGINSPTGTWTTSDTSDTIDYYTVKAGSNFAVYSVDPTDNYGSWSTYELWQEKSNGNSLEISHVNGYKASSVPLPSAVILFGSGLISLCLFSKKR